MAHIRHTEHLKSMGQLSPRLAWEDRGTWEQEVGPSTYLMARGGYLHFYCYPLQPLLRLPNTQLPTPPTLWVWNCKRAWKCKRKDSSFAQHGCGLSQQGKEMCVYHQERNQELIMGEFLSAVRENEARDVLSESNPGHFEETPWCSPWFSHLLTVLVYLSSPLMLNYFSSQQSFFKHNI